MSPATSLEHRRFLPVATRFRPFRDGDLYQRLGGQATVDRLVDALYERIVGDPQLKPLFNRDLTVERARQKVFFAEWLGGPAIYSEISWAGLAHRHAELPITRALAGRWLGHLSRALETCVTDAEARAAIFEPIQALAFALVNPAAAEMSGTPHGMCQPRDHPALVSAEHARRGDVGGLRRVQAGAPAFLERPLHAARVLHAAVSAGRLEAVTWLLDQGVDVDKPCALAVGQAGLAFEGIIFVTPLCSARARRRARVAALLQDRGAKSDVFTESLLGDVPALTRSLASDRGLAQAPDPAVDVVEVTPLHHAVSAGQAATVELLLEHAAPPLRGAERALRGAAALGSRPMVERLLAAGADAGRIGAGRWVLDPEIAPLLAAAGGAVDRIRGLDRRQLHRQPGAQGRPRLCARAAPSRSARRRSTAWNGSDRPAPRGPRRLLADDRRVARAWRRSRRARWRGRDAPRLARARRQIGRPGGGARAAGSKSVTAIEMVRDAHEKE